MNKQLLGSTLCAAVALMIFAMPSLAAMEMEIETVGGFAVKISKSLGMPVTSENAAVEALATAGVKVQVDLGARLTQNEAARILADLGMNVAAPADPNSAVSVGVASQLAASAGLALSSGPGIATDFPLQCLLEKNRGQCVGCCTAAFDFDSTAPRAGQISRGLRQVLQVGAAASSERS